MKIKTKRLSPNAVIPAYKHPTDAGMDMTATSKTVDEHNNVVYGTDIAMQIPQGYVGLIFPRSSIGDVPLSLSNCVGVIDSGYRGEIKFKFRQLDIPGEQYNVGDRIGQIIIIPYPQIQLIETDNLDDSDRGVGGFGSTGN